jgi:predicted anti-sigma-YlaC factor YlaD
MGFERSEEAMGISCEEVWRDISDYIDGDLDPIPRAALDQHFVECRHCAAVLEGTRNVIVLYRDERVLAPPEGFHDRLYQRLEQDMNSSRRAFLTWALTAAAAVPLALAALSIGKLVVSTRNQQRPVSEPDAHQVPEMVAISQDHDDKVYHVPGCSHLYGEPKFLSREEAIRDGYTPCVYCIGKAPKKNG